MKNFFLLSALLIISGSVFSSDNSLCITRKDAKDAALKDATYFLYLGVEGSEVVGHLPPEEGCKK